MSLLKAKQFSCTAHLYYSLEQIWPVWRKYSDFLAVSLSI